MKSYFYNASFAGKNGEDIQKTYAWGTAQFDISIPLEPQVAAEIERRSNYGTKVMGPLNIAALTPLESDSSNHTEKLIELWRIERTAGEYYGGKNTNAYINEELAKLGIKL